MKQREFLDYLEIVLAVLTIAGAGVAGLLVRFYGQKSNELALLTVVAICVVSLASSETLKRYRTIAQLDSNVRDIKSQLGNLEQYLRDEAGAVPVPSLQEVYDRASDLILGAHDSIRDTTWGHELEQKSAAEMNSATKYRNLMSEACKRDERLVAREIFGFGSHRRKGRLVAALEAREKLPERLKDNYLIRLFPVEDAVPLMDFMVVDGEKILFSVDKKHYLYVRSRAIGAFLSEYFDATWATAIRLEVARGNLLDAKTRKVIMWPSDPSQSIRTKAPVDA